MNKRILCFILSFGLFLPLAAHADVTIGVVGPLTGENAFFGDQMKHGVEQAATDINAQGGINGEKIVLRILDDACDPKQAVTVANQIISAGVKFVVGHFCSGAAIPASKIYNEEGIFMISPSATNPALTDAGLANVFRVAGRDDQQGEVDGNYIIKHYHDKKIAILQNQSTWGRDIAEKVKQTINHAGMKEVMFEAFTPGDRDYSPLITKLKQTGAEVAFIGGWSTEVGLIVRQMKEQGATVQVIGGDALVTDQFWSITGPAGEGVMMSFNPDPRKREEAKAALESIRKTGFEPEGYTLYSYAAVQVIAEGIARAGKADPIKVAEVVRQKPIGTVLGPIGFDKKGDVTGTSYVLYRWSKGKYAEIEESK
jgi:branched-chain amino acid transport system substrate-binding protein